MKLSKSKIIGLIALLAVVGVVCGTLVWRQSQPAPAEPTEQVSITGYLGGEKIGLFDDAKFKALAAKQGIAIDYRKAGSLAMMDADRKGMDYLFPSSRAAVEYGNAKGVKAPPSDIVFNSPIVLYTHKAVADGLVNGGLVTKDDSGAYHMDMAKAVDAMVANTTWADVGYTAGYGQFRIDSTDEVELRQRIRGASCHGAQRRAAGHGRFGGARRQDHRLHLRQIRLDGDLFRGFVQPVPDLGRGLQADDGGLRIAAA